MSGLLWFFKRPSNSYICGIKPNYWRNLTVKTANLTKDFACSSHENVFENVNVSIFIANPLVDCDFLKRCLNGKRTDNPELKLLFSESYHVTRIPLLVSCKLSYAVNEKILCMPKYHVRKCVNKKCERFMKYLFEDIHFSSDRSAASEICIGGMSINEMTPAEKLNPDSDDVKLDDVDRDDPEIYIVFEKLIRNESMPESREEESQTNEMAEDETLKDGPSPQEFNALPEKLLAECKVNSTQLVGSTSQYIDLRKARRKKIHLRELRQWDYTSYGKGLIPGQINNVNSHQFTLMSYNVLSQDLLENHPHLYYNHNPAALTWEWRSKALLEEIEAAAPDILCLQEVQESHLESFYYPQLKKLGYNGLYKKRTGDKPDGVAIFYKDSAFSLEEYTTVEFMQPVVPVLNRDNVALIARFSSKTALSLPHLCVATTHLLYNPRRMDVKLAQMQLLLAELERLAYVGRFPLSYYPLIITGDLNITPRSSLYRLLTTGLLLDGDITDEMVDVLGITSNCQHSSILSGRQSSEVHSIDRTSEIHELKVYNSDHVEILKKTAPRSNISTNTPELIIDRKKGQLSHNFVLKSAYGHRNSRGREVTTKQDQWVTVDYVFYSCLARGLDMEPVEGNLKLVSSFGLLCKEECYAYGPIPNLGSPSDHFPLICKFMLT